MSAVLTIEIKLAKALPESFETASQHDFHPMNAFSLFVVLMFALATVGQKILAIEYKVREACQADNDAHLAQLEHTHSLPAGIDDKTINNKVRARAYQGTDAAKNRRIA